MLFDKLEKIINTLDKSGIIDAVLDISQQSDSSMNINEWNRKWVCIGPLKTADLSPYNKCVGLYKHVVNGKTMYIGRAIELYNGGFRKRLSDYRRPSNSARKHTSGKIIHENLDKITTYILIVGDTPETIEKTKELERLFIQKFSPEWNKLLK